MADTNAKSLIESAAKSVDDVKTKYEPFEDDKELGETFRAAGRGLLLIEEALKTVDDYVNANDQAIIASLGSFKTATEKLTTVVNELSSKEQGNARRQCYVAYIEKKGRSHLVETLVRRMMEYVCQMLKGKKGEDVEKHLKDLETEIKKLKEMEPSVPFEEQKGGHQFTNHGGEQYNATDYARQFNGSTFHGGTTFN